MTRPPHRMLYVPPEPIYFTFMPKLAPMEVEVLEVDFENGVAKIVCPVEANALINVLRDPEKPPIKRMTRVVPRKDLRPLRPQADP